MCLLLPPLSSAAAGGAHGKKDKPKLRESVLKRASVRLSVIPMEIMKKMKKTQARVAH